MSRRVGVPDFVTHYYLADRRPFLNLSDLDEAAVVDVLAELAALHRQRHQHRPFGPHYMDLRRLTEARLRALFIHRGGRPERQSPHYFVLGESAWYERLAEGMDKVRLPLSSLPPDQTTITYPDSFSAMEVGAEFGLSQESRPYHGKVFLLDELTELVSEFGIPTPATSTATGSWKDWPQDAYIEVQLWTDYPIMDHLAPIR